MTTMTNSNEHPIAVLGGTGHTGRRVVERLRAGGHAYRVGSRSGTPPFRWERPETWPGVLDGCRAAYVAYTPDLAYPGAAETVGALAEQARRSGVERLVLLSGRGEAAARRGEDAVRAAGVPTTVLRSSVFAQNFSEHFLMGPVLDGFIALPAGGVAEPFLDLEDLADVATVFLTAAEPAELTLELTGPRLLTFSEAAAELSAALGREVVYQPVTPAEFVQGAVEAGVSPEEAEALAEVFGQIFDGRNETTSTDVERVLGHPARDFGDYGRRTAAAGAWSLPEPMDSSA
jgi:uncharacterized protein YbjT (DUF2867 family)